MWTEAESAKKKKKEKKEKVGDSKISAGIRVDGASECDHAEPGKSKFTAGKAEF